MRFMFAALAPRPVPHGQSRKLPGRIGKLQRRVAYRLGWTGVRRHGLAFAADIGVVNFALGIRVPQVGLNEQRAAEVIGCTVEEVMKFDVEGMPIAEKLLLLWDKKHVGCEGWSGFLFSRGVLMNGKHRWTADMLLRYYDNANKITDLNAKF